MACKWWCKIRVRFWMGVMFLLCTFIGYLSKTIVLLAVETIIADQNNYTRVGSNDNHEPENRKLFTDTYGLKLNTSDNSKIWISTAFYQGAMISSLIAGLTVEWYRPTYVVYYAVTLQAAVIALIYAAVVIHWFGVFTCFWISGFCHGFIEPAVVNLIVHWSPLYERSKFTFCLMGEPLAVAWTLLLQFHNWRLNFYSTSIVTAIFAAVWFFAVYNSPASHRWVSREERNKIMLSHQETVTPNKGVPPYTKIFTSSKFWLMVLAHVGSQWCYCVITSVTPKFMSHEMGFEHEDRMFILFHGARLLSGLLCACVVDILRMYKSYVMPFTVMRRVFICLSHTVTGLFLLSIVLTRHNWKVLVCILTMSQIWSGAIVAGHLQVALDLAPNYAATLNSYMNFFGYISWYLAIYTSTKVIAYNHGLKGWHIIYGMAAIITIVCSIPSVIFGTGRLEKWNTKKNCKTTNVKEEDEEKELAVSDLDLHNTDAKEPSKTNVRFKSGTITLYAAAQNDELSKFNTTI